MDMFSSKRIRQSERGQVLLVFALSIFVLLGILALVMDVGWGQYVGKKAQAAADAAALAAATEALRLVSPDGALECGDVACQGEGDCPASGNLQNGCQYASANQFASGGDGGRQTVKIAANTSSPAPGVPNVPVKYWVQVTTRHSLPQMFSGLLSSVGLLPSARATAAVREVAWDPSIQLLNRSTDCFVSALGIGLVCGEDLLTLGANAIEAERGIYMSSSNRSGIGLPNIAAGTVVGFTRVRAPFTYILETGSINTALGSADWEAAPTSGIPDGDYFTDPMAGKGQPPAPTGLPDRPVPGGVIAGSLLPGSPTILPPGQYYGTLPLPPILGRRIPTGLPVTITGNVIFSDGANPPCGGFCNYVFYGGLVTGALSTVTFSPGRYVFAGAQPVAGGPGVGFSVGVNSTVKDLTPLVGGEAGPNTDAGEIFIFTSSTYPGLTLPLDISSAGLSFPQARAGVVTGLGGSITLHGLNKQNPALPPELHPHAPVLIWQDRANTTLKYQPNGFLDLTCGGPCTNVLSVPGSQEMILQATQNNGAPATNLYGTIYGPRGAWLTVAGVLPGDTIAGPLQIITGALQMTLNANLDLKALPTPPSRSIIGLIQ
jgi:hypothetical protein